MLKMVVGGRCTILMVQNKTKGGEKYGISRKQG